MQKGGVHRALNCSNESCITCKREGHRADHTRCPSFSAVIEEKRNRRASRRFIYEGMTNEVAEKGGEPNSGK